MKAGTRYSVSRKPHRCVHCGHAMKRMLDVEKRMLVSIRRVWRCGPCRFDVWEFSDGDVAMVPWQMEVGRLKGLLVVSRQEKRL